MHDDKADGYRKRFARVLRHIDDHLDQPLSLEALSAVANFSPFHFHRQFSAYCGMPLARYIQWRRLKRASYRLAFNPQEKVIDIALGAGFQNPESFSRAFRQALGTTPSRFRQRPDWLDWHQRIPPAKASREQNMNVEIVDFPATRIALINHRGAPALINDAAARFIEWRKSTGLSPVATSKTFGIAPADPATTPAEAFSFDICGSVSAPIDENNPFGVVNGMIPAGRCARVVHQGPHEEMTELARALYRDWLPGSGEELRDFPLFFHYLNFVHEVPEHALRTDIYLPLK